MNARIMVITEDSRVVDDWPSEWSLPENGDLVCILVEYRDGSKESKDYQVISKSWFVPNVIYIVVKEIEDN